MPTLTESRTATRPKFPPLQVAIYRDGKQTKIVDLQDPREGYLRAWDEINLNPDLTAEPVLSTQEERELSHAAVEQLPDRFQVFLVPLEMLNGAEHAYTCADRYEAQAWAEAWEEDNLGMVAVIIAPAGNGGAL